MRYHKAVSLLFLLVACVARAQLHQAKQRSPSEVYGLVDALRADVESIRIEMGGPVYEPWELVVRGAHPRQVLFQARTLFLKADRLCFEHTRKREKALSLPSGPVEPEHVFRSVHAAWDRVKAVKAHMGLITPSVPMSPETEKTPSDVFLSIMHANRQINLLLEKRFSPSDVYREVTLSLSYIARVLALFPEVKRIPEEPGFIRGKQPHDVYEKLMNCLQIVNRIAQREEVDLMHIEVAKKHSSRITPDDVYDMATLLLAEVVHLHSLAGRAEQPKTAFHPGRKYPAHVYQRVGLLARQLNILLEASQRHPSWRQEEP